MGVVCRRLAGVVLYQVWAFVAPGLYAREKVVVPVVGILVSTVLVGSAFAYFIVFPTVFKLMPVSRHMAWRWRPILIAI